MSGEMKRMLTSKNFLAAWLIACASLLFGQTSPSLKKPLTCGAFISLLGWFYKKSDCSFHFTHSSSAYLVVILSCRSIEADF